VNSALPLLAAKRASSRTQTGAEAEQAFGEALDSHETGVNSIRLK
jgi:hypothetical protein